jgi:hypothetical protein
VLLAIYLASNAVGYFHRRQEDISRAIAARLRGLGTITAACLLASLVNPYGYRLHAHVYRYLSSRWLMNHIDEFLSPNFHGVAQQCFVLILLITIVGLALDRKLPLARLLVAIFAVYSGLYASRSLPVSSLLLTMVIAPLFTQAVGEEQGNAKLSWRLRAFFSRWAVFGSRMRNMELNCRGHVWPAGAMMLGVMVCIHQGKLGSYQWMDAHFDAKKFPVHASEVLVRRGIREPVFAQDSWGGYVIYRLYPENKVLVDDRHDLYGEEFLRNYLKTVRVTPDWENFLNDKHVNWALVPTGSSLDNMLKQTARWNVVYRDDTAILFARKMDQ